MDESCGWMDGCVLEASSKEQPSFGLFGCSHHQSPEVESIAHLNILK